MELALCRSAPARISKHYPEQRDLFMVRSIAPRSKNIGSTAGTVVTVPSIPHCPVSWVKRSEMACDLSPNVHPAIESCSHLSLCGSVKQRERTRSPRFNSSSRSRPLKLSTKAFCRGSPGPEELALCARAALPAERQYPCGRAATISIRSFFLQAQDGEQSVE